MATVKTMSITHTNEAGETEKLSAVVSVDKEGIFSAQIPDHVAESYSAANAGSGRGNTYQTPQRNWRAQCATLDGLYAGIKAALVHSMSVETVMETIIVFSLQNKVAYSIGSDGDIGPNGHYPKDGKWAGTLNSHNSSSVFSFGLFARVMVKEIHKRQGCTKIEYKQFKHPDDTNHGIANSWAGKLNGFVGLNIPKAPSVSYEEMPYTEEAAKFFYETMIGLCNMVDRAERFFADRELLALAIQKSAGLLSFTESQSGGE